MRRRTRIYEDDDISLALPDGWKQTRRSSRELLIFGDASKQRQLTVSVTLLRDRTPPAGQLLEVTRAIHEHRMAAERAQLGPDGQIHTNGVEDVAGTPLGVFWGIDSNGRMFMGMLLAQGCRIATAYLEGYSGTARQHMELGGKIFQGLVVKEER